MQRKQLQEPDLSTRNTNEKFCHLQIMVPHALKINKNEIPDMFRN